MLEKPNSRQKASAGVLPRRPSRAIMKRCYYPPYTSLVILLLAFALFCSDSVADASAIFGLPTRTRRMQQTVDELTPGVRRHSQVAAFLGRRQQRHAAVVDEGGTALSEQQTSRARSQGGRQLWPPWPFSLLQARAASEHHDYEVTTGARPSSGAVLLWRLAQQSTRVTLDKVRRVASQLWFHLPPGMPPFVLLALVPRRVIPTTITADTMAESAAIVQRAVPLWTDPFVRTIALSGLGLAIMSWAHYEIHRQRRLTPLPLAAPYRDLSRVVLPPFLPQEVPTSWMEDITTPDSMLSDKDVDGMNDDDEDTTVKGDARSYLLPPYLQKHVNSLLGPGATPTTSRSLSTTIREWQRMRFQRQSERQRAHRLSILDQLLALQSLKARATRRQPPTPPHNGDDDNDAATSLGYALVTGASRGIGRALAVELARYEIPLILVARDVDRLTALAYDLEACYGISCCVIAADLSRPGQAEQLYRTTQTAGLKVDILINNAGYSMQGQSVDMDVGQTNNLIQLNALSLSTLMHLYGRDMKARRRGRILNVSSICGATAGIPTVGVYAATKSFVNTLSRSLALELEPYGVGVTCVLPGAVKDTEFKARSQSHQAACWKIPFYPKAPQLVASSGIKALLRGETECTPGWENRFFLQVLKPAIPQRIHNLIAEAFWNPIHWPFRTRASPEAPQQQPVEQPAARQTAPAPSPPPMQRVPRLLQLDQVEEKGQSPVDSQVPDKHDEPVEEMEEPAVATEDQVDGTTEADANSVPEESTSPPPLPQEEHLPLDHEPAMVSRDRASSFRPLAFLRSREVPATHKKKD